jgi:hypothetical protein
VNRLRLHIRSRSQATATTFRVARLLSVPFAHAVWVAVCYLFTGRTISYKIEDKHWRVTP